MAAAGSHTILAPSAELAAALFDAVERAHRDSGRIIWPTPRVRELSGWLKERHALRRLEDAGLPRLLGDADERELWRGVLETGGAAGDMLDPAGAASAARRARRALFEYGIPLAALARHASGSEEVRAFLDWNQAFETRCRSLHCIDGAGLLGGLAADQAAPESLAWVDTPAWRPAARRWLVTRGRRLAPAELRRDPGAQLSLPFGPAARADPPSGAGHLHLPSPEVELATIAEWAAASLRANPEFRAWIHLPALEQRREEVVDAFDAALAPQRFLLAEMTGAAPYAAAGGTALAEFAPVRAALSVLDASFGLVTFEAFSALLRSPALHATEADAAAAALLDVKLRSRAPAEADLPDWLAHAERAGGAIGAVQRMRAAHRALDSGNSSRPLSRWVPLWMEALQAGPWADRGRWSSTEFQAAERFRELLTELALADAIIGARTRGSAQALLARAAAETRFQPQTGVAQIAISGELMDPWLAYDGLWIAGRSEDRWPPRADPIPLLPVSLQREYGVIAAGAETQLGLARDLQARWLLRARQCHFSFSDHGEGRTATASPLIPAAGIAAAAPTVEARPHWRRVLEAAPDLDRLLDEQAPPLGAEERNRGVATLKAQSRCAFRGFAETRLACEELERPVPGFNARERGMLVHGVLEQIWARLGGSEALRTLDPAARAALIDEAAVRAIARVARHRDPGPRWRDRERGRLQALIARWLEVELRRQAFTVESIEERVMVQGFGALNFEVRIDRVDRLDHGERVLIDYKTGSAERDWSGERPDNPQLPLYAVLRRERLVAAAYAKVNAAELKFVAEAELGSLFGPRSQRSRLEGFPDLASLIAAWEARLRRLAEDFSAGRAAVAPTPSACKTCKLQCLCRVPSALDDDASGEAAADE